MTYGYITVNCPRCGSTIEIAGRSARGEAFICPVCAEGEITCKADLPALQPALQPVMAGRVPGHELEHYITTLSNIWTN